MLGMAFNRLYQMTHTHTHTHTHECLKCLFRLTRGVPALVCNRKHDGRVSQRYRFESRQGNGHFFPSCRRLYLSSFSLSHTHTHTHTHTHIYTHSDSSDSPLISSYMFRDISSHASARLPVVGSLLAKKHQERVNESPDYQKISETIPARTDMQCLLHLFVQMTPVVMLVGSSRILSPFLQAILLTWPWLQV